MIRFFYPVLILLFIQLFAFLSYEGFRIQVDNSVKTNVIMSYLSEILVIIIFSFMFNFLIKRKYIKFIEVDKRINFLFLLIVIIFIVKPIVILNLLGFNLGYDYLRIAYFQEPYIKKIVYGHELILTLTSFYIIPITWLYIIFLFNAQDKLSKFTFYFLLTCMVVYNLSYAGRMNIVYAVLILYYRSIYLGGSPLNFVKKYTPLLGVLFVLSFIPLLLRSGEDVDDINIISLIELMEYHILQPFYLSQKIQLGYLNPTDDSYPFRIVIQAILSPIYFLLGYGGEYLSFYYYQNNFLMDFSLSSKYSSNSYNAYATYMAYFYVDYGYLTPIFIFIVLFYILSSSILIKNKDLIIKYLIFISLMMYSSLFMGGMFAPGPLFIIIFIPILLFFIRK